MTKMMMNVKYEMMYVAKWIVIVAMFMYCMAMNMR